MVKRGQRKNDHKEMFPPWAVDPLVKKFLADEGIELSVYADKAFLKGIKKQPLFIFRKLRQNHTPHFFFPEYLKQEDT
jgi:hypothetical protein